MAKTAFTVTVNAPGMRATLAAFRALPKEASDELRTAALELSELLAGKARAAAGGDSAQAALMAPTVRVVRDRVPAVQIGGSKRVGRHRVPAWKILFGAEFGSHRLPQFRPFTKSGYFFFPLIETEQGAIAREWQQAADRVIGRFTAGGDDGR